MARGKSRLAIGFKSSCENAVAKLRAELDIPTDDEPICMNSLADHLEIPLCSFDRWLKPAGLQRKEPAVDEIYRKVSAFTAFDRSRRAIFYNEEHAPNRHRSNLAHELAHAILHHPPEGQEIPALQGEIHEEEAVWMAGVLMLTAVQARKIEASGMSHAAAVKQYRVSDRMLKFRINVTRISSVTPILLTHPPKQPQPAYLPVKV